MLRVLLLSLLCVPVLQAAESYSLLHLLTRDSDFDRRHLESADTIWRSRIGNDALGGKSITDQYYTNSLSLTAYSRLKSPFLYDEFRLYDFDCYADDEECGVLPVGVHSNRDLKLVSYGWTLDHRMYTPYEHAGRGRVDQYGYEYIENAEDYDRPFAGWASIGRDLRIEGIDGYQQHRFSVGVVGPLAGGRWMQEKAHEYPFKGPSPIDGWETQVENRMLLQYEGKLARHLVQGRALAAEMDLGHFAMIEAGTIINRLGYGLEFSSAWPARAVSQCDVFSPDVIPFLDVSADRSASVEAVMMRFKRDLEGYRDGVNYIPDGIFVRLQRVIDELDVAINDRDERIAQAYQRLGYFQNEIRSINEDWRDCILKSCHHSGFYTKLIANTTAHFVISNYLIEGDVNVPEGADWRSDNPIMREGGKLAVRRKPFVLSASAGFDLGYGESMAFGYRYHYRSEETLEQAKDHSWSELVFEFRNDWGWVTIPAILVVAALNNQSNWP